MHRITQGLSHYITSRNESEAPDFVLYHSKGTGKQHFTQQMLHIMLQEVEKGQYSGYPPPPF